MSVYRTIGPLVYFYFSPEKKTNKQKTKTKKKQKKKKNDQSDNCFICKAETSLVNIFGKIAAYFPCY